MEYNNYYPVQSGHPPPNQQHAGGLPMQQQQQQQPQQPPPQSGGHMMHSPMPQQNIRQPMPPGPPNHLQQMQQMQSQQQQQHIGHHPQQLNPQQQQQQQQQQHPNYQQIQPPHPHGPPVSHSSSPHAQQQQHQQQQQQQQQHHHQPPPHQHQHQHQHQHHNHSHSHQSNMPGQMPQTQAMSQHVHSQSPHHHGGPMHMQQQQQSLNQMVRPPVGPSVMNHAQPGMPQPIHHQHNFFASGGPMPQQANIHHYPQNPHHPNHHQPPIMHHIPPMSGQHPQMNHNIGRNSSPYYPNILQTEFRIIELNRRLQCRPIPRHPYNPLPIAYDESMWWEKFASDFFEDDATLTLRMHDDKPVDYTIGRTLIPRFFRSYFTGGVTDLSFNLRNPKETCIHPHLITLDCDQAFIVTNNIFRHPSIAGHHSAVVHTEGHLVIDFVSNSFDNLSIKSWRFYFKGCREYIDRSIMSTIGLPPNYLAEPITKNGFTRSTLTYLKMCMIMEPMQELMFQNRQTKLDPRACLRKLLFDRYKFRSGEDNRAVTNKRRKRKPSAATAVANNASTNKKSKPGMNAIGNNTGMNNMMMSPSNMGPNISLASQDVMVVGEPSMMGGDFGDDNERMITRLENTQYDPTHSNHSIIDESDSTNAPTTGDITHTSEEMDQSLENRPQVHHMTEHSLSPSSQQQHQRQQQSQVQQEHHQRQQQLQQQAPQQQQQIQQQPDHLQKNQSVPLSVSVQTQDTHYQPSQLQKRSPQQIAQHTEINQGKAEFTFSQPGDDQKIDLRDLLQVPSDSHLDSDDKESANRNQEILNHQSHNDDRSRQMTQDQDPSSELLQSPIQNGNVGHSQGEPQQIIKEGVNHRPSDIISQKDDNNHHVTEETTMNSISDASIDASIVNNVGSVEPPENHSDSVQMLHEEPDSNSLLQCSTPTNTKSTIEQHQPVDNGVA